MTPVLVDSNVIVDVMSGARPWSGWSSAALESIGARGILVINPLIYAEVSVAVDSIEALDDALPRTLFVHENLPYEAAFVAGKAFLAYRRQGGIRRSPLPDFYIGAHAAVAGYRLLTRDSRRYRSYFPTIELIAPS